jgi:hypothetical protein
MTESLSRAISADDAAKILREKVKLSFAEIIPEEQWEQFIKTEFDKFTKPSQERLPYNRGWEEKPSVLSTVMQGVLRELAAEKLKEHFQGKEMVNLEQLFKAQVEKELPAALTALVRGLFENVAEQAAQNLSYQITNNFRG